METILKDPIIITIIAVLTCGIVALSYLIHRKIIKKYYYLGYDRAKKHTRLKLNLSNDIKSEIKNLPDFKEIIFREALGEITENMNKDMRVIEEKIKSINDEIKEYSKEKEEINKQLLNFSHSIDNSSFHEQKEKLENNLIQINSKILKLEKEKENIIPEKIIAESENIKKISLPSKRILSAGHGIIDNIFKRFNTSQCFGWLLLTIDFGIAYTFFTEITENWPWIIGYLLPIAITGVAAFFMHDLLHKIENVKQDFHPLKIIPPFFEGFFLIIILLSIVFIRLSNALTLEMEQSHLLMEGLFGLLFIAFVIAVGLITYKDKVNFGEFIMTPFALIWSIILIVIAIVYFPFDWLIHALQPKKKTADEIRTSKTIQNQKTTLEKLKSEKKELENKISLLPININNFKKSETARIKDELRLKTSPKITNLEQKINEKESEREKLITKINNIKIPLLQCREGSDNGVIDELLHNNKAKQAINHS